MRWAGLPGVARSPRLAILAACSALLALPTTANTAGPPSADQAPPFPVPDDGYAVEGRPGPPGSGFVLHYDTTKVGWQPFEARGFPKGLQRRLLSGSPSMGAITQITYVPERWSQPAGYDEVDSEILVLDGDLAIGDDELSKYSYSYIPGGVFRGSVRSRQGAVLLHWFKGPPNFVAASKSRKGARENARVRDWHHFSGAWYIDEPFPAYRTGGNFPGALHKLLRQDPDTGEMTWLSFAASIPAPRSTRPGNFGGGYEVHPSFEEYYFLEKTHDSVIGECLEQGETPVAYGNGTYWWRPGGVAHGGSHGTPPDAPGHSISVVRTGTSLWATYVTDCTYETGLEITAQGWKQYDYDVPRYRVKP